MVAFFCCMYCIFLIIFLFILFINSNYLLKLRRLLHERIDKTVEELRKKPQTKKFKRVQRCKSPTGVPPVGTPNWCLSPEALKKLNRTTENIPEYNTDHDEDDEYHNNTDNDKQKKKRKRKKKKEKRAKKHKN